jgi:hypothetical protein
MRDTASGDESVPREPFLETKVALWGGAAWPSGQSVTLTATRQQDALVCGRKRFYCSRAEGKGDKHRQNV